MFKNTRGKVNVELKFPEEESDYETSEAVQDVIDMIVALQSAQNAFISSFETNALDENFSNANDQGIEMAYFYNFYEGQQNDDIGVDAYSQT